MIITTDKLTPSSTPHHHFSTESSDIGLRAWEWPPYLRTTLGNGQDLVRSTKKVNPSGDLMWVTYVQPGTQIAVKIFND